jgi:predicted ribonuclease YlaK
MGFLPGDIKEKMDPYLRPFFDVLQEIVPTENQKWLIKGNFFTVSLKFRHYDFWIAPFPPYSGNFEVKFWTWYFCK